MAQNSCQPTRGKTRSFRHLWPHISSSLVLGLLFPSIAPANAELPHFSVDPASPAIDGTITSDDVLRPGPAIFTPALNLGLKDNPPGDVDSLNSLSYGKDRGNILFFSVDRVAVGLLGTDVNIQAQPGAEEAAGDVYQTLPPLGSNILAIDEEELGLEPGFFGDDLDSLELNSLPMPFTYFSLDFLSATNDFGAAGLADDILISAGDGMFATFADGITHIGLLPDDDLDALILFDGCTFGELDLKPNCDFALFSVSTFSPSAFTYTGNSYIPGVREFLSPADILFTDFTGDFSLWAKAEDIGLFPDDELDALDILPNGDNGVGPKFPPIPEPSSTLGLLVLGTLGVGSKILRKKRTEKLTKKPTDRAA